ncbi:MAG: hypothetical protein KUG65_04525 [Sphingomonadaceae bacterium]|nr:hypothetical protein [Sphingomonadaceae bacterium]
MLSNAQLITLADDGEWERLNALIGASSSNTLLSNILESARTAGCRFALLEGPYIDRDFSASFTAFYASLFRPYKKLCKRLHLFSDDLSAALSQGDPSSVSLALEAASPSYMGYLVLRPLVHAPVSHAFLSHAHFSPDPAAEVSVRSDHHVHVLGATLGLAGFPLTQQDTRIGACAQASIWMAGRHFHLKHKGPWFSLPEITSSALLPTDSSITRSLPAGSDYLTSDNMVRALRAMGRHPVFYAPQSTEQGDDWGFDPQDVICQYVDSGIPVILGLNDGQNVGHAAVAVGTVRADVTETDDANPGSSQSAYCSHLLVMDDQRGAYLRLPIDGPLEEPVPFNLRDHLRFMIVPLPNKVFMTSEVADQIARGIVANASLQIDAFRSQLPEQNQSSWPPEAQFYEAADGGGLVARTYLTYGWKYKSRALRNNTCTQLKADVLRRDFPKYVWVTEFSYPHEVCAIDPCARIVRAHVVTDATGSRFWESYLIADIPGVVATWDFDTQNDAEAASPGLTFIATHNEYFPKIRGMQDFTQCGVQQTEA